MGRFGAWVKVFDTGILHDMANAFFKNRRVYLLTLVAYMGSFLFGYDTGVMGSVLELESFKNDFGMAASSTGFKNGRNAEISSNVVSLLTAGCFFGALAAPWLNERLGRRYSLMIFSLIFMVGAAVQTGASHAIGTIYGGRVIAGLGIGGMSAITPVFVSENCPPDVRGRISGLFQEFLVLGVMFSYWLCYGVKKNMAPTTMQWRVPVGLQLVPSGIMFCGLWFLKESPRWLAKNDRHDEALASLAYIRCVSTDDPEVLQELAEIRASVEEEFLATEGLSWKECLKPGYRERFGLAFCIMFWQQWSGTNSIGYYAPQIFASVGLTGSSTSLFATGIYGTVKVIATGIFLIIGIERFGRKWPLVTGAWWMASCMFIIGALLVSYPPDPDASSVSSPSIAMVVMIYLYVIGYSASWGPVPWVYVAEIFPTRLRAYGVGLASATQWLFNFVVTKVTPAAINSIGWRTFIMFGCFCTAMGVFVLVFLKETTGRSLEEMDILFGAVTPDQRKKDVELAVAEEYKADPHAEHVDRVEEQQVFKDRDAKYINGIGIELIDEDNATHRT
ncbi:general substrate transporter, partial [Aureobasidium melanogenum]